MKKKIKIITANPAGNITIFVLDKFPREAYSSIAGQLLAMEEFHAEQVAFITGEDSFEMCGLEFCGNASRTFALMTAKNRSIQGNAMIEISASGCSKRLSVEVNTENNYTKITMPMPVSVQKLEVPGHLFQHDCHPETSGQALPHDNHPEKSGQALPHDCCLVDFEGISHVVICDTPATKENFNRIKEFISKKYGEAPATGVMFYDTAEKKLVPVVYVKDVDTTYFEGSCGSGSTAAAIAFSQDETDGTFSFTLSQPAGTLTATAKKENGQLKAVYIEGPVSYSQPFEVQIEVNDGTIN